MGDQAWYDSEVISTKFKEKKIIILLRMTVATVWHRLLSKIVSYSIDNDNNLYKYDTVCSKSTSKNIWEQLIVRSWKYFGQKSI